MLLLLRALSCVGAATQPCAAASSTRLNAPVAAVLLQVWHHRLLCSLLVCHKDLR